MDRYAVRCGGAHNHRDHLGAGILIKENHIRCAGSLEAAVQAAKERAPHTLKVECEVETLEELERAIACGADIALLDNMSNEQLREAAAFRNAKAPKVLLEASGGITLERLGSLAETGVNLVSVGALTHSVPAADLSLLVELEAPD